MSLWCKLILRYVVPCDTISLCIVVNHIFVLRARPRPAGAELVAFAGSVARYIYIYIYIYKYIHTYMITYNISLHISLSLYIYIYIFPVPRGAAPTCPGMTSCLPPLWFWLARRVCVCIYIYIYIYMYNHIHLYVYTYIYIYKYVHLYVYVYIYIYIHISIHIYIYICILFSALVRLQPSPPAADPSPRLATRCIHQRLINGVVSKNTKYNNFGFAGIKRPF